jgi:hypothetical protein
MQLFFFLCFVSILVFFLFFIRAESNCSLAAELSTQRNEKIEMNHYHHDHHHLGVKKRNIPM